MNTIKTKDGTQLYYKASGEGQLVVIGSSPSNILFQKAILTPEELAKKMDAPRHAGQSAQ
jgi:hypothetical protein